jgi:hypothetical protein
LVNDEIYKRFQKRDGATCRGGDHGRDHFRDRDRLRDRIRDRLGVSDLLDYFFPSRFLGYLDFGGHVRDCLCDDNRCN